MIPEYLILSSEQEARELGLMTQYFPVEEGEVFTNILECICFDDYADLSLEAHAYEVQTAMIESGHYAYAEPMAQLILQLGRGILRQLRELKAYHNGYLIYGYHQDLHGDLVLRALQSGDLEVSRLKH